MAFISNIFLNTAYQLINRSESATLKFYLANPSTEPDDNRTAFTLKAVLNNRTVGYICFRISSTSTDGISSASNVKFYNRSFVFLREYKPTYDDEDDIYTAGNKFYNGILYYCSSLFR